ncbi:DUF389 domain-containing protein [Cellulomonas humilata]|uniref:Hydrophobic protein (TIGR00271 family) n=1 Tax=Cellulomonas humilata TaxID=144055 RepID=A0ABU0EID5_9CELL|nr:DUF389 domain-containing protein [Cellulomonas humilata]MDQ0375030.1 putative hydrophobic protein (TIGR00271 family) [Cellulomonas humilata]
MASLTTITADDIDRIRTSVFIEPPVTSRSSTRFWVLLVLASVIASAGVVADSTATVIGAMIVAPLMTPILGIALAVVLADRPHLLRSLVHVVLGALVVIAIGYLVGMLVDPADNYVGNSQVAGRISPKLIDLLAALATGTVGAFALVRSDISDALPGVAIAISLVPPLSVTGLLLEAGRTADAAESTLLFLTNVAAIIATGTLVLGLAGVRSAAQAAGGPVGHTSRRTIAVVVALLVVVAIPLAAGSVRVARDQHLESTARPVAEEWAREAGWEVTTVTALNGLVTVDALGPPPSVDPETLRDAFDGHALEDVDLRLRLVVGGTRLCPADADACTAPVPGR